VQERWSGWANRLACDRCGGAQLMWLRWTVHRKSGEREEMWWCRICGKRERMVFMAKKPVGPVGR